MCGQLCAGAKTPAMEELGVREPEYYSYLSMSSVTSVEGTDDKADFEETISGGLTYWT